MWVQYFKDRVLQGITPSSYCSLTTIQQSLDNTQWAAPLGLHWVPRGPAVLGHNQRWHCGGTGPSGGGSGVWQVPKNTNGRRPWSWAPSSPISGPISCREQDCHHVSFGVQHMFMIIPWTLYWANCLSPLHLVLFLKFCFVLSLRTHSSVSLFCPVFFISVCWVG